MWGLMHFQTNHVRDMNFAGIANVVNSTSKTTSLMCFLLSRRLNFIMGMLRDSNCPLGTFSKAWELPVWLSNAHLDAIMAADFLSQTHPASGGREEDFGTVYVWMESYYFWSGGPSANRPTYSLRSLSHGFFNAGRCHCHFSEDCHTLWRVVQTFQSPLDFWRACREAWVQVGSTSLISRVHSGIRVHLTSNADATPSLYSLVQWNWFSDVTGCMHEIKVHHRQWRQRTHFTAPDCMPWAPEAQNARPTLSFTICWTCKSASPSHLSFSRVYLAVKKAESLLEDGENHAEQIFVCLPCCLWAISSKNRVFRMHVKAMVLPWQRILKALDDLDFFTPRLTFDLFGMAVWVYFRLGRLFSLIFAH